MSRVYTVLVTTNFSSSRGSGRTAPSNWTSEEGKDTYMLMHIDREVSRFPESLELGSIQVPEPTATALLPHARRYLTTACYLC